MAWNPPAQRTRKREAMPSSCFLDQKNKKYPYKTKRNGEWKPSRQGLIAAKKRAAQQHDTTIENKADRLLDKYFPSKK